MEQQNKQQASWEIDIRSDMWHTMTRHQLATQQDLIYNKLSVLSKLGNNHPTALSISLALRRALDELNDILNKTSE